MEVPTYSPEQRQAMVGDNIYFPPHVVKSLSDEQFGYTFDEELRRKNPAGIVKRFDPFRPPGAADGFVDIAAKGIRSVGRGLGKVNQSGYLGAGATGIGLGALGGYGLYKMMTRKQPPEQQSSKAAILGAILGAGLLGTAAISTHNYRTKTASADTLIDEIQRSNLSYSEKQQLIAGVRRLSSQERDHLARTTRGFIGAALGAAVARFLRSKGLIPMIAGGIIGGALGWSSFSTPRRPTNPLYIPKY